MIQSFIDLLNESSSNYLGKPGLVGEMGIKRVERLTGSHIGRQRQETINRQQSQANVQRNRSYIEVSADLMRALKNVVSTEISIEKLTNSETYFPRFGPNIVELMNELISIDRSQAISDFGKWRDFNPTNNDSIYFKVDPPSAFQRSHFPNGGITTSLRGIGLGYKLYRALLRYKGYLSSNSAGTREKDKVWASMLSYKANPDGTPSVDDCRSVICPANWLAIDKQTLSEEMQIEIAIKFIKECGISYTTSNSFDMDDELISIMPDHFMATLTSDYLQSLVRDSRISEERFNAIEASRGKAERLEAERVAREREARRQEQLRQEEETRLRLQSRIERFGANFEEEWQVGDFIVIKQYLLDETYGPLPIRRVLRVVDGMYSAYTIAECILANNGTHIDELNPRTTNDKTKWVKVDLERIPDLNNVNLGPAEKEYIKAFLNPEARQELDRQNREREERRLQAEREENQRRLEREAANRQTVEPIETDVFGPIPDSGSSLKQAVWVTRRELNIWNTMKAMKDQAFTRFMVLPNNQIQRGALRQNYGVGVYLAFRQLWRSLTPSSIRGIDNPNDIHRADDIYLMNMATGYIISRPYAGLGLTAFILEPVTMEDKLHLIPGTHYYIASNDNNFGVFAKATRQRAGTQNRPFIYLNCYGYGQNDIQVRLTDLKKVTGTFTI